MAIASLLFLMFPTSLRVAITYTQWDGEYIHLVCVYHGHVTTVYAVALDHMTITDLLRVDVEDLGSLGAGDFHETAWVHLAGVLLGRKAIHTAPAD